MTPATITEPQFIAALAARGVTVNRAQVNQFRPVAKDRGDCRQYGEGRRSVWLWEPSAADVWEKYLKARAFYIAQGEWHSKRKYEGRDVERALAGWGAIERAIRMAQQQQEAA